MRLTDLNPRWLIENGVRVGFVFVSPTDPKWNQTCFFEPGRKMFTCVDLNCTRLHGCPCATSQAGLVESAGIDAEWFQGCKRECGWAPSAPVETLSFETISVTPSIDGSAGGLWHGFITNGEIVGGLP